jgi:hypothetical protein
MSPSSLAEQLGLQEHHRHEAPHPGQEQGEDADVVRREVPREADEDRGQREDDAGPARALLTRQALPPPLQQDVPDGEERHDPEEGQGVDPGEELDVAVGHQEDPGADREEAQDDPVVGLARPVLPQEELRKAAVEAHAPGEARDPHEGRQHRTGEDEDRGRDRERSMGTPSSRYRTGAVPRASMRPAFPHPAKSQLSTGAPSFDPGPPGCPPGVATPSDLYPLGGHRARGFPGALSP